jgi:hypothetical protein
MIRRRDVSVHAEIDVLAEVLIGLAAAYSSYRLFAVGTYLILTWGKRDDAEHVRLMAEAHATVIRALMRPPRRWTRRTKPKIRKVNPVPGDHLEVMLPTPANRLSSPKQGRRACRRRPPSV